MKALAEILKPYLKLLRVGNLAFVAILLYVMEKWVVVPLLYTEGFAAQIPWWVLTIMILSVVLIAAGGYVINDYFDVKIDRINRPDDLVVTNVISRDVAMRIFQVCTILGVIAGVVVAWWAHSWNLLFVYIVIPGLLWFYSASYKRMLLIGNWVVAFVSAIVPLLVAMVNADILRYQYHENLVHTPIVGQLYLWLGSFALFAFLLTWVREMIKDMEDIEGDRELECRSVPIVWGMRAAKVMSTILLITSMAFIGYIAFAVLPFPMVWRSLAVRYVVFGLMIPILCVIVLLWAAKNKQEYQRCQLIVKLIMFLGVLFSFVIQQNLYTL
jgi:4-hydroxybenzoate polyprenyltransferase